MRDKLIELIKEARDIGDRHCEEMSSCAKCHELGYDIGKCGEIVIADYLIAHGVTFSDVPDNNVGDKKTDRVLLKEVSVTHDEESANVLFRFVVDGVDVPFISKVYHRQLVGAGYAVKQEWIPVSERLPEPFVSVLVQMPGEEPCPTVREGYLAKDGTWYGGHFLREPGEVTHWMPMPEYKETHHADTD